MSRKTNPWPWFLTAWLTLTIMAAAWTLTAFDECYKAGYNQFECISYQAKG